jgi:hypothetical protein
MSEPTNQPAELEGSSAEWSVWYWKQVERAQEDISSSADSFDKSMLTLSSGALGVSLAVIKDIVPIGQAIWKVLLLTSWIAFALCITTTVASFLFSIAALRQHRELLDRMYSEKNRELENTASTRWNTAVHASVGVAFVLFLVGLFCTMIFIAVNVGKNSAEHVGTAPAPTITNIRSCDMSNDGQSVEKVVKPQSQGVEKGRLPMKVAVPPKAQKAPTTE